MEITSLSIWFLLVLTPGILSNLFFESLIPLKKGKQFSYLIIRCWLLGISGYATYYLLGKFLEFFLGNLEIVDIVKLLQGQTIAPVSISILFFSSLSGILNTLLLSKILKEKVFHRFCRWIKITKSYGDIDVWSLLMNNLEFDKWCVVRETKNNICYLGWVQAFSDHHFDLEIMIRDVTVYLNDTGEYLYESPLIYLAKDSKDLSFEFYKGQEKDKNEEKR